MWAALRDKRRCELWPVSHGTRPVVFFAGYGYVTAHVTEQDGTSRPESLWLAPVGDRAICLRGNCSASCTLHRAPVGQGPSGPDWLAISSGPDWLAISFGFWSGRALATGTAWAGLCLIHHHHQQLLRVIPSVSRAWVVGDNLAPSPARAYRRFQGAEHAYGPGGLGEP